MASPKHRQLWGMRPSIALLLPAVITGLGLIWGFVEIELRRGESAIWRHRDAASASVHHVRIRRLASLRGFPLTTRARVAGLGGEVAYYNGDLELAVELFDEELKLLGRPEVAATIKASKALTPNPSYVEFAIGYQDFYSDPDSIPDFDDSDLLSSPRPLIEDAENAWLVTNTIKLPNDFIEKRNLFLMPDENREAIAELVESLPRELELIHLAVGRSGWRKPLGDTSFTNLHELFRLAANEFVYHCQRGDPEAAAKSYHAAMRMLVLMEDEPSLVCLLVTTALRGELVDTLDWAFESVEFSQSAIASMSETLGNSGFRVDLGVECARYEYQSNLDLLQESILAAAPSDVIQRELLSRAFKKRQYEFWSAIQEAFQVEDVGGPSRNEHGVDRAKARLLLRMRPTMYGASRLRKSDGFDLARAEIEMIAECLFTISRPNIGRIQDNIDDPVVDELVCRKAMALALDRPFEPLMPWTPEWGGPLKGEWKTEDGSVFIELDSYESRSIPIPKVRP